MLPTASHLLRKPGLTYQNYEASLRKERQDAQKVVA